MTENIGENKGKEVNLSSESKQKILFYSAVILVGLGFLYYLFGMTGARVGFGIIFVSLPFYILLGAFNLSEGEIVVFSVLAGFTLFSSVVYLLGLAISFRISILIAFFMLMAIALVVRKFFGRKKDG